VEDKGSGEKEMYLGQGIEKVQDRDVSKEWHLKTSRNNLLNRGRGMKRGGKYEGSKAHVEEPGEEEVQATWM